MRLPPAILANAEEVLREILRFAAPADTTLSRYFKDHHRLGGRERGAIAECIYNILRNKSFYTDFSEAGGGATMRRLTLHFDMAALEQRQVLQRRLLQHAQAQRRERRRRAADRRLGQAGGDFVARALHGVDAQVQRRRLIHAVGQQQGFFLAHLLDQLVEQPLRHVRTARLVHHLAVDLQDVFDPFDFFFRQAAQRLDADRVRHAQEGQTAHGGAAARFGEIGIKRFVAQHVVHALGNGAALGFGHVLEGFKQLGVVGRIAFAAGPARRVALPDLR